MKQIVLIGCARQKLAVPAPASMLYRSQLFTLSLQYAQQLRPDAIFILSAKHGLMPLDQELAPYDQTLSTMPAAAVRQWATGVLGALRQVADLDADQITLLAGARYRQYLMPALRHTIVPLAHLPIGRQIQFLQRTLAR